MNNEKKDIEELNIDIEPKKEKDEYKASRVLYIFQASFEYFINLLLAGAYIARVTSALGIRDSLTGVITSIMSFASAFQFIAIFLINKRPVKIWVSIFNSINQLLFAFVYLVPIFNIPRNIKIVLFASFLIVGYIINQIIDAPKINRFMSLVDEHKRGSFTATKERVAIIGAMIFTFIVGSVIDYYDSIGNTKGSLIFCSIAIIVLAVLHTCTLVFAKEKPVEKEEIIKPNKTFGKLLKNKSLLKAIFISSLWRIAIYISTPFYGTYQIKELGFSMLYVSILSAIWAILRSIISKPIGKLADKSYILTLKICYTFSMLASLVFVFLVPSNGKVLYIIYNILLAVATAGIENCEMNLTYSAVDEKERVGALAIRMTILGLVGFFTTLGISPLVKYIQENDNMIFGIHVYAQQVVSLLSVLITLIIIVFLIISDIRNKKTPEVK